jgi:hypothetical protein
MKTACIGSTLETQEYTRDQNVSCCSRHSDFPEPRGHVMPCSFAWRHSNPYCSAHSHDCTLRIAAQVAISVVYQHVNLGAVQNFRNVRYGISYGSILRQIVKSRRRRCCCSRRLRINSKVWPKALSRTDFLRAFTTIGTGGKEQPK